MNDFVFLASAAPLTPLASTPEELVAQARAVVGRFQGEAFSAATQAAIQHEMWSLLDPHRGVFIPPNIRIDVTCDAAGAAFVDVVDVDEERERAELWMRFFEAWLGVPRERIVYDGDPLP